MTRTKPLVSQTPGGMMEEFSKMLTSALPKLVPSQGRDEPCTIQWNIGLKQAAAINKDVPRSAALCRADPVRHSPGQTNNPETTCIIIVPQAKPGDRDCYTAASAAKPGDRDCYTAASAAKPGDRDCYTAASAATEKRKTRNKRV
ncbi:hypothetical protein BaRGS_00040165 [Batillaria attramentaria]|uniref:Uncharacterized protein n=1 Tax=Batillaria attramentaria TaxID=370345 RepID=A0ABD0J131_9CAEN